MILLNKNCNNAVIATIITLYNCEQIHVIMLLVKFKPVFNIPVILTKVTYKNSFKKKKVIPSPN